MKSFNINDYNALKDLRGIFSSCRQYWQEKKDSRLESFLIDADNVLSNETIDCLIISDYNTTGLTGAKTSIQEKSVWRALTHSDGVTNKSSGSAGSYGIGKNAPFACSSLRTVFYNTYAEDGVKAFQGVARLVTHENDDGKYTQGVGFYQYINDDKRTPIFEEDDCDFRDVFNRSEFGTDVVVIGLNKVATWEDDIEKAIINNFFVCDFSFQTIHDKYLATVLLGKRFKTHSHSFGEGISSEICICCYRFHLDTKLIFTNFCHIINITSMI
jgi:hypothetical protein